MENSSLANDVIVANESDEKKIEETKTTESEYELSGAEDIDKNDKELKKKASKDEKDPEFKPDPEDEDDISTEEEKDDIEEAKTLPCEKKIKKPIKPRKAPLLIFHDDDDDVDNRLHVRRSERLSEKNSPLARIIDNRRRTRNQTKK